jgi:hypothetical protein
MPRVASHGSLVTARFASLRTPMSMSVPELDRHIAHGVTDGPCPHHKE